MDPNHFLMWILLRFELFDYFNGSCSSKDQVFDFVTQSFWKYLLLPAMLFLMRII